MESKACLSCGEMIRGRSDKKFCSDQCRNAHHNIHNSQVSVYMRNVNSILRKNRKILEELNPTGKASVQKDKLSNRGFNFQFFTNIYKTKTGNVYYFCYEQGYIAHEKDFYTLVTRKVDIG